MMKNLITKDLLLKTLMLLAALVGTTGWNTVLADDSVTVGDVSNSECANRAKSESVMGRPTLKLTRYEGGLIGELIDFEVNCAYGDVKVMCEENGQKLAIGVDENTGGEYADCICQINIYFTIFNALQDEYQLTLCGRDIGTVSFKEHSVVQIDLETLEQAYEEGFDYPVMVQHFDLYEITEYVSPEEDLSQSLEIYNYGDKQLHCVYMNYALPCEYTTLDVQAGLDEDSTLVVEVLTDGIPTQECKRVAHLNFDIVNTPKSSYHLRLNHTTLIKDGNGQERKCTVCLYEGDIKVPLHDSVSIPINGDIIYSAVAAGVNHLQIEGTDPSAPYYDQQGRRHTSQPRKGIYIRDGKKIVAE